MMVSINGPALAKFNLRPLVRSWFEEKVRRFRVLTPEQIKVRKQQEYFRPMFSDAKLRAKKLKQATGLVLADAVQGGEESFSDDELEEDEILDYNILD